MAALKILKSIISAARIVLGAIRKYWCFRKEFRLFRELSRKNGRFRVDWDDRYPCLDDRTAVTGFDRHYVYHSAWAARILAGTRPLTHIDISSTVHFCALVSAFIPVRFYDYRPADLRLEGLHCEAADLLQLPFANHSVASLSCMHVVEHVGLGRYGDPVDPDGDLKAIAELRRVLAVGGNLLFVVPVGKPRVAFNAHRIYSYDQIASYFQDLSLRQFALIPDDAQGGGIVFDAGKEMADAQSYGCGCFWFEKRSAS